MIGQTQGIIAAHALPSASRSARCPFLLASSVFLLVYVRFSLLFIPFCKLRSRLLGRQKPLKYPDYSIGQIVWAVKFASSKIPGTTCLMDALTCQAMLCRQGHKSRLQIGVFVDERHNLHAHAWVEQEGRTIFGNNGNLSRYHTLDSSEG